MARVLVIDDDRAVRLMVRRTLEDLGIDVLDAADGQTGWERASTDSPDVVLLDVVLPDRSGLDLFEEIHRFDGRLPVVFITALHDCETAIEAMKRGGYDVLLKPVKPSELEELVERAIALRRSAHVPVTLPDSDSSISAGGDPMVGHSRAMVEVYKEIGRVAPQDVTVLIRGESGTGKELVARAVFQHSRRADKPFLTINCAAIPDQLLESELFGHEKGSFTGAETRRIGKFEQCDGGTIFLDEIGDMPLSLQAKMLRLLQQQRFERVGGNTTVQTNVRIIAATNRDLEAMVDAQEFRADLLFRLNDFTIQMPPLRDRKEDIEVLLDHFLDAAIAEFGCPSVGVSSEAIELIKTYHWPGNIRELRSVVRRACLRANGTVIMPESLPAEVRGEANSRTINTQSGPSDLSHFISSRLDCGTDQLYSEVITFVEKQLFAEVMRHAEGNKSMAARTLGITRGFLRRKLSEFGVRSETVVLEESDDEDE